MLAKHGGTSPDPLSDTHHARSRVISSDVATYRGFSVLWQWGHVHWNGSGYTKLGTRSNTCECFYLLDVSVMSFLRWKWCAIGRVEPPPWSPSTYNIPLAAGLHCRRMVLTFSYNYKHSFLSRYFGFYLFFLTRHTDYKSQQFIQPSFECTLWIVVCGCDINFYEIPC